MQKPNGTMKIVYIMIVVVSLVISYPLTRLKQERVSRVEIKPPVKVAVKKQSKKPVKKAQKPVESVLPAYMYQPACERYKPIVERYFGSQTAQAMLTMQKESSCIATQVSATNDYGLFQLNGIQVFDPEENIKIALGKYKTPRVGTRPNWSAWYAVCSLGSNPQPKYEGIACQ